MDLYGEIESLAVDVDRLYDAAYRPRPRDPEEVPDPHEEAFRANYVLVRADEIAASVEQVRASTPDGDGIPEALAQAARLLTVAVRLSREARDHFDASYDADNLSLIARECEVHVDGARTRLDRALKLADHDRWLERRYGPTPA